MHRWRSCALAVALAWGALPAHAEAPSAQRAKIVEFMEITGARDLGEQVMLAMVQQVSASAQQANPNVPKRVHELVRDVAIEVLKEHSDELFSKAVVLYEKHFTEAEIDELLAFYRSPIGKKTIQVMPVLMGEMVAVSQAWGQGLEPLLQQRIRARLAAEGLRP
jgi:uncharacterized protein